MVITWSASIIRLPIRACCHVKATTLILDEDEAGKRVRLKKGWSLIELIRLFRRVMPDRRSGSEERERKAVVLQQAETEALVSLLRKINGAFQEYFGPGEVAEEYQDSSAGEEGKVASRVGGGKEVGEDR